ncbi:MAG: crossover junction endodeoxyribonuclease RuvC [bacterium]|nr:crossover junction endodeoxyribonuclease RuvC [bacterium]
MRILGIDPGTSLIGFGVIETTAKGFTCVDYGVCRTPSNIENTERVITVHTFFKDLIKKYRPDQAGIERLFFFKNAKTVTQVSEIKGVILLALKQHGVPTFEFTPLQIKQAVSNYGRAEKHQVQKNISMILGLKEIPQPDDAADALAIALCCANTTRHT